MAQTPWWARTSSFSRLHDHTQTHHSRYESSGRVISPTQRTLPDNTQQSHDTNTHASSGIRTRIPSKRTTEDPHLRPRGHWDRQFVDHLVWNIQACLYIREFRMQSIPFRFASSLATVFAAANCSGHALVMVTHRTKAVWRCQHCSGRHFITSHRVDSSWNVMAHGDAREGKWRGNWRMEWVASTLHTTSEHGLSSITTADAHTSAASSRLNWRPRRFKWIRTFRRKTKSGFCACAITFQLDSTTLTIRSWHLRFTSHLTIILIGTT